ncbi:hypothetical protein AVEN_66496-1 [Araneus ventricosus]|uniref:Uncharacterized protein n=1 Tax=Araneus ventricosus TaxID=182803 RepID=A0A4Y2TM55_ARAVE|nr:hypothetical protein AVEN_66496-1 [Araneus ventricosus]
MSNISTEKKPLEAYTPEFHQITYIGGRPTLHKNSVAIFARICMADLANNTTCRKYLKKLTLQITTKHFASPEDKKKKQQGLASRRPNGPPGARRCDHLFSLFQTIKERKARKLKRFQ